MAHIMLVFGIFIAFWSTLFLEKFFQIGKENLFRGIIHCSFALILGIVSIYEIAICLLFILKDMSTQSIAFNSFIIYLIVFFSTLGKFHGKKLPLLK